MVVKRRNIPSRSRSVQEQNPVIPARHVSESMPKNAAKPEYSPVQPSSRPPKKRSLFVIISLLLLFILGAGGTVWYFMYESDWDFFPQVSRREKERPRHKRHSSSARESGESEDDVELDEEEEEIIHRSGDEIFKRLNRECESCVVLIEGHKGEEAWDGTGFIIYRDRDPDGLSLIMTNLHVAQPDAESFYVMTKSRAVTDAVLVGMATDGTDLAVLAIQNIPNLKPIWKLRSSKLAEEGDAVYTVGHPVGLDFTVSPKGMLNRKRYSSEKDIPGGAVLQHSAPISPGNSGGPLVDSVGNIIGVNTSYRKDGNNLYFAIPVEFLHKEGAWRWDPNVLPIIQNIRIQGE